MIPVRSLLPVAAATILVALGSGCDSGSDDVTASAAPGESQHFRSRPDLTPPPVEITTKGEGVSPGYIFLAPKTRSETTQPGPMIIDNQGRLVWFLPLDTPAVTDFRVQTYDGQPVLTWWRGRAPKGVGDGYYVIMDRSYNQIAKVTAGNGLTGDVHEFMITPRNTALITVYERQARDLSSLGGPTDGAIFEGVIQEVDIESGRVLFEWHSSDHVALSESLVPVPKPTEDGSKPAPYDYFHINSVAVEPDGNLLISARNTSAIYEIRKSDGRVLWRLGGKKSDFEMGAGTKFAWQHDARRQADGTITLFDNGADPKVEEYSRVLRLSADPVSKKARLVTSYAHPKRLLAGSQGNAQFLPNGNVFVGWGAEPYFTEFTADGTVVLDGTFRSGEDTDSYRVYRFDWAPHPVGRPAIAVAAGKDNRMTVSTSWNGSTEVSRWQVLTGTEPNRLHVVASAPRRGFETAIPLASDDPYVSTRALNARGAILGTSLTIGTGQPAS